MKKMTDEQLRAHAVNSLAALNALTEIWRQAMKQMPINSAMYRKICAAGKSAQTLNRALWIEAENREFPMDEMSEIFSRSNCVFN